MDDATGGSRVPSTLHLLTRDGAIAVVFRATLTPDQYEAVYDCVDNIEDAEEMKTRIEAIFRKWSIGVEIDKVV